MSITDGIRVKLTELKYNWRNKSITDGIVSITEGIKSITDGIRV